MKHDMEKYKAEEYRVEGCAIGKHEVDEVERYLPSLGTHDLEEHEIAEDVERIYT